jgi:hypothetical protein
MATDPTKPQERRPDQPPNVIRDPKTGALIDPRTGILVQENPDQGERSDAPGATPPHEHADAVAALHASAKDLHGEDHGKQFPLNAPWSNMTPAEYEKIRAHAAAKLAAKGHDHITIPGDPRLSSLPGGAATPPVVHAGQSPAVELSGAVPATKEGRR